MIRRITIEVDVDLNKKEFDEWITNLLHQVCHDKLYKSKIVHGILTQDNSFDEFCRRCGTSCTESKIENCKRMVFDLTT